MDHHDIPVSRLILLVFIVSLLAACGKNRVVPDIPPDELYRRATVSMKNGSYESAIRQLRAIQARFPFSEYAIQSHLDLIYPLVRAEDPESAIDEADRFIDENPRHQNIDYAYYMRGLAFYGDDNVSFLGRWFKVDLAKADITDARIAFQNFRQMLQLHPHSQYAADARQRLVALRNRIARHELYVADYYMRREAYVSALNRAKYVVEDLPNTPSTIAALQLMAQAYRKLDLLDLAETIERVIIENGAEIEKSRYKKHRRFPYQKRGIDETTPREIVI